MKKNSMSEALGRLVVVAPTLCNFSCSDAVGDGIADPLGSLSAPLVVFEDTFAPQQPGWSVQSTSANFLGPLNNTANVAGATLTLNVLATSDGTLDFDLLTLGSLDPAGTCCTDTLTMLVNDQLSFTGSFGDRNNDTFYDNPSGASMAPAARITGGFQRRITVPVTLQEGMNTFTWSYSPLQPIADESWGIAHVVVDVQPALTVAYNLTETDGRRAPEELQYLSTDAHGYHAGRTPVFGSVSITGEPGDVISRAELSISGSNGTVAVEANSIVGQVIPPSGSLTLGRQLLFEVSAADLQAKILPAADDFTFEIETTMVGGASHVQAFDLRHLVNLENLAGMPTRYPVGDRNAADGGDSWVRPHAPALIARIADSARQNGFSNLALGDCSSLNGGPFDPHLEHDRGLDADLDLLGQDYDRYLGRPFPRLCSGLQNTSPPCRRVRRFQREFAGFIADVVQMPEVEKIFIGPHAQEVFDRELERRVGADLISAKIDRDGGHWNHFHVTFRDQ